MTTIAHTDVLLDGLNQLVGVTLNYAICQTEPLSYSDVNLLSGAGGKRVTNAETLTSGMIVVSDGINSLSKKIIVPSFEMNSSVQVIVSGGSADLWLVIYDGSRVLLRTDQITNQELLLDATVVCPSFDYGINQ